MIGQTDFAEAAVKAQKNELTEYHIFSRLAKIPSKNQLVLKKIADESLVHYKYWEKVTKEKVSEDKVLVFVYHYLAKIFGLTFAIKMLERKETEIESLYENFVKYDKKHEWIVNQEKNHEKVILRLIDEDFLNYASSVVLGSSDALVELTGTLAGLSLTLQDHRLIGVTGLITGIAASLSMASSEYLSTKSDPSSKNPIKAATITGVTYIVTTLTLIFPYFLLQDYLLSLLWTMFNAVLVIILSSFYLSVTKEMSFRKRFIESTSLSFGVAFVSFLIGILVHQFLHLDI